METFGPDEKNLDDRSASVRPPLDTLNGRSADFTSDAARYVIWITFLIVVCALTLFANLEGRDLWGADEARHAERAWEMMASRQWMTPTYLGQPDFDKPPVHYWLMAGAGQLFGPVDPVFFHKDIVVRARVRLQQSEYLVLERLGRRLPS